MSPVRRVVLSVFCVATLLAGLTAHASPGYVGKPIGTSIGVEFDPTTNLIYSMGGNGIEVFDASSYELVRNLDVPCCYSGGIAVNTRSQMLYLLSYQSGPPERNFHAVDLASGKVVANLSTGDGPGGTHGIAVNEVTNRVYVTNYFDGTVTVIDGATNQIIDQIDPDSSDNHPMEVAVNSVTNRVYVTDARGGGFHVIDGATNQTVYTYGTRCEATALWVDEPRNRYYLGDCGGYFYAYDGATNEEIVEKRLNVGWIYPESIVSNPTNGRIYVGSSFSNKQGVEPRLWVLDASTFEEIDGMMLGGSQSTAKDMAINPAAHVIYLVNGYSITVVSEDATPPVATFITRSGAMQPSWAPLTGEVTDTMAGVDTVTLSYSSLTKGSGETQAEVTCSDAARLSCTWRAWVPGLGAYFVNVKAADLWGNQSAYSESILVIAT